MFRYTLDVDGKTAAVDGFFTPEYYYSLMFPMDEMFKLLDIKYTFEKDCLTVDTTNAKQFSVENSERISGNVETPDICYLYIDKVVADGEPAEIKYQYSSGHFENMTTGSSKAMPYVLNGKVYVNFDFVKGLTER